MGSPNKTMASILGKKSELDLDCNPLGIAESIYTASGKDCQKEKKVQALWVHLNEYRIGANTTPAF